MYIQKNRQTQNTVVKCTTNRTNPISCLLTVCLIRRVKRVPIQKLCETFQFNTYHRDCHINSSIMSIVNFIYGMSSHCLHTCPLLQSQSGYCQYIRGVLSMFAFCTFVLLRQMVPTTIIRFIAVVILSTIAVSGLTKELIFVIMFTTTVFSLRNKPFVLFWLAMISITVFFMECFVLWQLMLSISTVCCFPFDFCQRRSSCSWGLLFYLQLLSGVCQSYGSSRCGLVYCSLLLLDV